VENNTPKADADLSYPVLMPFKFNGAIVKPPAFVQMSADEAVQYIDAKVIGEEAAVLPTAAERLEAERVEAERLEAERVEGVVKAAIKPGDKAKLAKP
jgi:hypothetical protein